MPGDKFYGQLTLRTAGSLEQATADLERAVEVLTTYCPEILLFAGKTPGAGVACKGLSKLKDRG